MWMDDLRRNMDRKAKADALPDEIRKAHREQYRNVCRDAAKACIIGMAETMTGKPQDKNVQLSECVGQIIDEFERGMPNGVIVRIGDACAAARDGANRAGCTNTDEDTPFDDAGDKDQLQAKYIAIASACDAYTTAFARNCEDFCALEAARKRLEMEV